ncbi:MAG TPA: phage protease [Candidatus Binataceae bacterium]|nr:phage protease [Candidatus Binataceae bacterium]
METLLEQLCEILGLEATAPDDEIIAEVRRLAASADDDDDAGDDDDADDGDAGDDDEGADAGLAGAEDEPRGERGRDQHGNDSGAGDEMDGAPRGKRRKSKKPSPAHYVAVSQFQKVLGELNVLRAQRGRERAEQAVDDAIRAGKLVPAQRQWGIAYCQADYEGFVAFATRQPAAFGPAFDGARSAGAPRSAGASLTATEAAVCNQLGLDHDEYRMRRRGGRNDFLRLNRGGDGAKENH